tara:strand:+ start:1524 stop:1670 length:147 start_codon:yes stop_codon:yes gene_type:complete
MGITGFVASITGSAIKDEGTGSLIVLVLFVLVVLGVSIFLIRKRKKEK